MHAWAASKVPKVSDLFRTGTGEADSLQGMPSRHREHLLQCHTVGMSLQRSGGRVVLRQSLGGGVCFW